MSLHEVESRSVGRTGWQEARVGLSPTLGWQWEGCFSWCSTTCFKAFWVSNLGSIFSSSQMDWPLLPVTIKFLEYPILSQTPLECATLQDGMIWNGMSFPCIVSHPAAQQCSKYWSPCLAWKKKLAGFLLYMISKEESINKFWNQMLLGFWSTMRSKMLILRWFWRGGAIHDIWVQNLGTICQLMARRNDKEVTWIRTVTFRLKARGRCIWQTSNLKHLKRRTSHFAPTPFLDEYKAFLKVEVCQIPL